MLGNHVLLPDELVATVTYFTTSDACSLSVALTTPGALMMRLLHSTIYMHKAAASTPKPTEIDQAGSQSPLPQTTSSAIEQDSLQRVW